MEKKIELLKLEYDYEKTWVITLVGITIALVLGVSNFPKDFLLLITSLLIVVILCVIVLVILFHLKYKQLKKNYLKQEIVNEIRINVGGFFGEYLWVIGLGLVIVGSTKIWGDAIGILIVGFVAVLVGVFLKGISGSLPQK